jgi:hypothetical protein
LIARAYTSVSLPLVQTYLGSLPVDQVLSGSICTHIQIFPRAYSLHQAAQQKGWTYDAAKQILSPLRTSSRGQDHCKHQFICKSWAQGGSTLFSCIRTAINSQQFPLGRGRRRRLREHTLTRSRSKYQHNSLTWIGTPARMTTRCYKEQAMIVYSFGSISTDLVDDLPCQIVPPNECTWDLASSSLQ